MNCKKIFLFIISVAVVATGCKSSGTVSKTSPASPSRSTSAKRELSEEELMNLQYIFFNANKEKITGNIEKAQELFAQCIRMDGSNDASMYELAQIYAGKKKFNDALFFIRSAAEIKPKNSWYKILLAEILQKSGKYNEAVTVYENLVKEYPHKIDYYFEWANALLYAGKSEEAIKVFDKIEEQIGVEKELIVQKERLYLKLGKTDKAAAEVEKLIAKTPNDLNPYSLLVELYQANGMKEKVLETIKRMQAIKAKDPHVYLALAEYYRSNNEKEKSFEQLKLAFSSTELESEVKFRILTSYVPLTNQNPEMLEQSLTLGRLMTETHPREALAHALFGDFLSMAKQPAEARDEYRTAISLDNKNEIVWINLLIVLSELNENDSLLKESDEALSLFPNNPAFYLFNGTARYFKKMYDEAISTFLTGSKLVVDNDAQLFEFYSRIGDSYHELKNHSESDKYYEKAIAINPNNAYTLNNYAYYLSERGEKLEKAENMSKLSNEIMPNQASFQDTYAWILYKLGKFKDAKEWLEKAMNNGGDKNGTILEHYGDVLFKLNEITNAIEYWNKAKLAGDVSDLLDKKIADKKLIE